MSDRTDRDGADGGDGCAIDGLTSAAAAEAPALTPIDAVLRQGSPPELKAFSAQVTGDPLAALEYAEVRHLVEFLRDARTAPSPGFTLRLEGLCRRATRRQQLQRKKPSLVVPGLLFAAAAALWIGLLAMLDPLPLRARAPAANSTAGPASDRALADSVVRIDVRTPQEPQEPATLAAARQAARTLLAEARLLSERQRSAVGRFLDLPAAGHFASWLAADNAAAAQRAAFERRASRQARRQALQQRQQLPEVDDRVQQLAEQLAAELDEGTDRSVGDTALAVRALLAAGEFRCDDAALQAGVEQLTAALVDLDAGELATALAALGEFAVCSGVQWPSIEQHGARLLASVLEVQGDTWTRRRPQLLAPATPVAQIADAGRFLRIAPALGLPAERALLVRMLLGAHLQEQRRHGGQPELLAALAYGFLDVLTATEREEVEQRLCHLQPATLAPDFVPLQQLAWSRAPDEPGFARFQLDLRRVGAMATPVALGDRAAFCLCLATSFMVPNAPASAASSD